MQVGFFFCGGLFLSNAYRTRRIARNWAIYLLILTRYEIFPSWSHFHHMLKSSWRLSVFVSRGTATWRFLHFSLFSLSDSVCMWDWLWLHFTTPSTIFCLCFYWSADLYSLTVATIRFLVVGKFLLSGGRGRTLSFQYHPVTYLSSVTICITFNLNLEFKFIVDPVQSSRTNAKLRIVYHSKCFHKQPGCFYMECSSLKIRSYQHIYDRTASLRFDTRYEQVREYGDLNICTKRFEIYKLC